MECQVTMREAISSRDYQNTTFQEEYLLKKRYQEEYLPKKRNVNQQDSVLSAATIKKKRDCILLSILWCYTVHQWVFRGLRAKKNNWSNVNCMYIIYSTKETTIPSFIHTEQKYGSYMW